MVVGHSPWPALLIYSTSNYLAHHWRSGRGRLSTKYTSRPNFVPEYAMRLSLLVVDECTVALCCVNPFWIPDM